MCSLLYNTSWCSYMSIGYRDTKYKLQYNNIKFAQLCGRASGLSRSQAAERWGIGRCREVRLV